METTDRTIAAEARAVEEGHHAFLDSDAEGPFIRVKSDLLGHTDKVWKVRAQVAGPGLPVIFDCTPEGDWRDGHKHLSSVGGHTKCKHMALAARRLEREGLVRLQAPGVYGVIALTESRWVGTDKATPVDNSAELDEILAGIASGDAAAGRRRAAAMQAAAEGPGGDPFAGMG